MRRGWSWTRLQQDRLERVKNIVQDLQDFWPLTLRQIHYQLVGVYGEANTKYTYQALSKLLKHARLDGLIPWRALVDRERWNTGGGFTDCSSFVQQCNSEYMQGYWRDLQQNQPVYLELWVEKAALASIVQRAADPYTVSVSVCKGYSSVAFLEQYRRRLHSVPHRQPVLLYIGDFDPSGLDMLPAMEQTLNKELGCCVHFQRLALTFEQIKELQLLCKPEALKVTDARAKRHVAKYGRLAVELDALTPQQLIAMVQAGIEAHIDLKLYQQQVELEQQDKLELQKKLARVRPILESIA